MSKNNNGKNFFLLSFLPAAAYWYLEANHTVQIAIIGGLILSILEISLEYIFTKHVHTLSRFNFLLIVFLGALSLMGEDGIWFKLQPAFSGVVIGGFMGFKLWRGKGLMAEMVESMGNAKSMPSHLLRTMETHTACLFFFYGLFMVYCAFYLSTGQWLFFKTGGFYIAFAVFMVFEMLYLRSKTKKEMIQQRKIQIQKEILGKTSPNWQKED